MPFVKKSDPQDTQTPADAHRIFIGRTDELHFFVEHILTPKEPIHNIVSVSGQGGVGKSTLLTQFIGLALSPDFKDYCLIASVDERQVTPVNIMEKFASQLHITGEFEKALTRYKEALRRLQTERDTGRDTLLSKAPDLAGSAVEDVPIMGGILREGAKAATGFLVNEHRTRQLLRDAERLENPIGDLTKAFVEELNRLTETQITLSFNRGKRQRRIILFFDTFELLSIEASPWLLDYFLQAEISNQVVLVVAGRDPIERSTPSDPKRWLPYCDDGIVYSISLDSFTEEETRNYLVMRAITEPNRIATIWQLSQGLPLYLGLLTSNRQGTVDPTKDVVVNFLRWIPEQEQLKRRFALDASLLSKPFNQDDLEAFSYLPEHERSAFYQWLTELPFVRTSSQDGRHSYHDLAEVLFSRHLFQRSRKEYYATRRALANYYQRLLEKTEVQGHELVYRTAVKGRSVFYSAEWVELAMAVAYQLFLLPDDTSHNSAIEQVLYAYEYTEHTEEIVRILRKLSQQQLNDQISAGAQHASKQLLLYVEGDLPPHKHELLVAADGLLKIIANKASFSFELLAHIYRKRGFAYRSISELKRAIADYNRAIELDPNYARAYASRGSAYRHLKEYERAVQDYDRALAINPNYAWAYFGRGETYRLQKDYLLALRDLNRAIELEPNYARAYSHRGLTHLWLNNIELANNDYKRSWELSSALVNSAWRSEWIEMCQKSINPEMAERLRVMAETNQQQPISYICWGVVLWFGKDYAGALVELEQAISLDPLGWDAYFWRGIAHASLSQNEDAIAAIKKSLELGLPPMLLAPLRWLEHGRPDFYIKYVIPLLARSPV